MPTPSRGAWHPHSAAPAPSSPSPGENSLYRIAPDGTVREIFRSQVGQSLPRPARQLGPDHIASRHSTSRPYNAKHSALEDRVSIVPSYHFLLQPFSKPIDQDAWSSQASDLNYRGLSKTHERSQREPHKVNACRRDVFSKLPGANEKVVCSKIVKQLRRHEMNLTKIGEPRLGKEGKSKRYHH